MSRRMIKTMKKYLVVAWMNYYPDGALDNLRSSHDTLEEARQAAEELAGPNWNTNGWDNVIIVDRDDTYAEIKIK